MLKLNYVIEKDKHGYYGYCPELDGCHTQGDSYEETKSNLTEAIELIFQFFHHTTIFFQLPLLNRITASTAIVKLTINKVT